MILVKEIDKNNKSFEDIKHVDENGVEFWYARELQKVLNYSEWRKFEGVIKKAKTSCANSGIDSSDHFVGIDKMVQIGSGATRKQQDYKLTRYACYLIAQNGDSRKKDFTKPEDLPTPTKSLKQLEKENQQKLKKQKNKSKNDNILFIFYKK